MAREIARKITLKQVGWTQEAITTALAAAQADPEKPKNGVRIDLMTVVGIVRMARPGYAESTGSDFLRLVGEFRATNSDTGESTDGAQCILPNFVADHIGGQLSSGSQVEFAIKLGAETDDKAIAGYTFHAVPLIETKASDRLEQLTIVAASANVKGEPLKVERRPVLKGKGKREVATA